MDNRSMVVNCKSMVVNCISMVVNCISMEGCHDDWYG